MTDPRERIRAVGAQVGNQALVRMLAPRRGLARMKIVEVEAGTEPGSIARELVEFSATEKQPSPEGGLGPDDPYHYTPTATANRYHRVRRPASQSTDLRRTELYATLNETFEENALLTAAELRQLADQKRGDLAKEQARAVVELFLDQFFERAIRFSSEQGLRPKSATTQTFADKRGGGWDQGTLTEAGQHMSQNSDATNMLSLALSEGALLRNAGREVCTLMYDSGSPKHAPFIYEFLVPKNSLITPQELILKGKLDSLSSHRSKSETEVLFWGTGLERYATGRRANPYTEQDRLRIQNVQESEEEGGEQLPAAPTRTLDFSKFRREWAEVKKRLEALKDQLTTPPGQEVTKLLQRIADLVAFPALGPGHGMLVRTLDADIAAAGGPLGTAWNTAMSAYIS